ncbi:MAG: ABC transporter ATP-binding protein [Syntrophotaleaceae bacterium]
MSDQPLLQLRQLHFDIAGKEILRDITCSFSAGRIHGIIGPNGSGKSSLLKNLCRIWQPRSGQVLIEGRDYRKLSRKSLSRFLTLVQQETRVDFSIRVLDFVAMGRHPHLNRMQWLRQRDLDIVEESLAMTGTEIFRERLINELSGGEGQLVNIARALATEAPVILLDEPISALDIRHKLDILELLAALRGNGKTILICIHDLDLARRYCDTITMLRDGAVFFQGTTSDAFSPERIKEVFDVDVDESATSHGISLLFHK